MTSVWARSAPHPLQAFLLACTAPLFLGALVGDIAYASSYEVQWLNFAAWLNFGGMIFAGFTLVWALIGWFRAERWDRQRLFLLVVIGMVGLGFITALVHAKDAWATMPEAVILSALVALLALFANWIGFSKLRAGGLA